MSPQSFQFTNVVRRSGEISRQILLKIAPPNGAAGEGSVFVIVAWPKAWEFFGLDLCPSFEAESTDAELPDGTGHDDSDPYADTYSPQSNSRDTYQSSTTSDANDLARMLNEMLGFDLEESKQRAVSYSRDHLFIAGMFRFPQVLAIDIALNTDSQQFVDWSTSNDRENSKSVLNPRLMLLAPKSTSKDSVLSRWLGPKLQLYSNIPIDLGDICDLQTNDGCISFDIGNNASTVAMLNRDASDNVEAVELLRVEAAFDGDEQNRSKSMSMLSTVRVFRYAESKSGESTNFPEASWEVGASAVEITSLEQGKIFSSVKRYLGDPSRRDRLDLTLDRNYKISRILPAELFITSLVRRVHQLTLKQAYPVVATYPSTYAKAEIEQVRIGIAKAICRATNRLAASDSQIWKHRTTPVPKMYDEATAAAFFFLFRDFIRGPARLHGFHYLYPRGMNMLLIDCGGGTTDIALIHAATQSGVSSADGEIDLTGNSVWKLRLANLGRTGNRFFGGDNITAAFFRILKWFLASRISDASVVTAFPRTVDEIPKNFIAMFPNIENTVDGVIPTRQHQEPNTVVGNVVSEPELMRIRALRALWNHAENCKKAIGDGKPELPPLAVDNALSGLASKNSTLTVQEISTRWLASDALPSIDVVRKCVDLLIMPEMEQLVDSANALLSELNKRLSENALVNLDDGSAFIHHVYLVGQGALYPLIPEVLKKSLNVHFLGEPSSVEPDGVLPRFVFDKSQLKGAVARGASLLRMAEEGVRGSELIYEDDLSERLPFTVVFDDNDQVGGVELFKENTRYRDLPDKIVKTKLPVFKDTNGNTIVRLSLCRKWPGSKKLEKFIEFTFPKLASITKQRTPATKTQVASAVPSVNAPDSKDEVEIHICYDKTGGHSETLGFFAQVRLPINEDGAGRVIWPNDKDNVSPLESGRI